MVRHSFPKEPDQHYIILVSLGQFLMKFTFKSLSRFGGSIPICEVPVKKTFLLLVKVTETSLHHESLPHEKNLQVDFENKVKLHN